jgi:outer membrane protein assembly factor BamB
MRFLAIVPPLLAALAATAAGHAPGQSDPASPGGWAGRLDGVWHWTLPDTDNGLRPTQSWHAVGSSPSGDIYVGGMDHATNAALYRLESREGALRVVGDARSASERARNWMPGETAQKFHTRPLWHDGKIYVATMDRSDPSDEYLSRRGFHWYAYDPRGERFVDLSASEPGGTGAPHGGLVALASDPARNVIYGAGVPTGEIYRFDVTLGRTENLGRPRAFGRPYVYANRVMWVDSRGRLYFSAGHPLNGDYDAALYGHIHSFDPAHGFAERRDWRLEGRRALEVGQCVAGRKRCFFADDQGHVYRFEDDGPSWTSIGKIETGHEGILFWMFQVAPDGTRAYVATSSWRQASNPSALYEFDLRTGDTTRLVSFADLGPELARRNVHTGYDAWDRDGQFYFASFSGTSEERVMVTRIDPERLKAATRKP